jgi:hypothetical protein
MKRKAKPVITKPPKYFNGPWVFPVPGNLEFLYQCFSIYILFQH